MIRIVAIAIGLIFAAATGARAYLLLAPTATVTVQQISNSFFATSQNMMTVDSVNRFTAN